MQNINHGKYINYLILWRNSEIDAASALKEPGGREGGGEGGGGGGGDKEKRKALSLKTSADYMMF